MDIINYKGVEYPTKKFNGYVFASHSLWVAISRELGIYINDTQTDEAVNIDKQIAFFFDNEEFDSMTAEELYHDYMITILSVPYED